jgi:hypothetical protein
MLLSACGTTSGLKNASDSKVKLDLSRYDTVIINNFEDGITESKSDPKIIEYGVKFSDIIATKLESKKIFSNIQRNVQSTENALLIDGDVTQLDEGNAIARTMLGFGAGSSHFDAKVYFRDNATKEIVGDIIVDKTSWALGGVIAGSQDVKSHMESAASTIAEELKASKISQP